MSKAKSLVGSGNVNLALELISYDEEVAPAMKYVFGSVLVCTDMTVASKVAFDPNIRCKCVTLDGQVVDPGGSMTGGNIRNEPIIQTIANSKHKTNELQNLEVLNLFTIVCEIMFFSVFN